MNGDEKWRLKIIGKSEVMKVVKGANLTNLVIGGELR